MRKKYLLSSNHHIFASGIFVLFFILIFLIISGIGVFFIMKQNMKTPSVSSLYTSWQNQDYESVYANSELVLQKRPLDGTALALEGFSAYYLYVEQTDQSLAQTYLNTAIIALRKALHRISYSEKPQIAYILGKAYYQRGYYYADLAMHYLDYAYNAGLKYADLAEFRGLAASQLGDYQTSINAFTEALSKNPSDLLLFSLAKDYQQIQNSEKAKQYFSETIRVTKDDLLVLKCHYELGMIFYTEQKFADAQKEFESILEKDSNSADAHYGLGVVYEALGDMIRARAEWRKAIKSNPVHPGARQKLNI